MRKRSRGRFPLPKVVATKLPDPFLRTEVPQNTKANDRELDKFQSFILDALAPRTNSPEGEIDDH